MRLRIRDLPGPSRVRKLMALDWLLFAVAMVLLWGLSTVLPSWQGMGLMAAGYVLYTAGTLNERLSNQIQKEEDRGSVG